MTDEGAYILREQTGTTSLQQTVLAVVRALADLEIPHLIVGGLAVQEYGYYRVTLDVDIVVPDVLEAVEFLTADLSGPWDRLSGCEDTVRDRRNGVVVNFLPANGILKAGCQVPFPQPTAITAEPKLVSLPELISLKLDSWSNSPVRRLKDKADVVELIARLKLPRDYPVAPAITNLYQATWDALQEEQ